MGIFLLLWIIPCERMSGQDFGQPVGLWLVIGPLWAYCGPSRDLQSGQSDIHSSFSVTKVILESVWY